MVELVRVNGSVRSLNWDECRIGVSGYLIVSMDVAVSMLHDTKKESELAWSSGAINTWGNANLEELTDA